jgi:cyclase
MLQPRLIASLLVDDQQHLVKTRGFSERQDLGDPLNAAYVFSGYEVDELLVLDIDATPQGRGIPLRFVEALARFTRVPLCIGGGIHSLDQIHDLLALGVEKVVLSGVLRHNFFFLTQAAERFGSSTISVVLNLRRPDGVEARAFLGRPLPPEAGHPLAELALAVQEAGAGELLLHDVEREGFRVGFDVPLLARLNPQLHIPLVALGGCGEPQHITDLLAATPLSGVAAGSLFAYAPASRDVLLNYVPTQRWLRRQRPQRQEACGR